MESEVKVNFIDNQAWEVVPRTPGLRELKTKWLLKLSALDDGSISKVKARLVACSYNQREGGLHRGPRVEARLNVLPHPLRDHRGGESRDRHHQRGQGICADRCRRGGLLRDVARLRAPRLRHQAQEVA